MKIVNVNDKEGIYDYIDLEFYIKYRCIYIR